MILNLRTLIFSSFILAILPFCKPTKTITTTASWVKQSRDTTKHYKHIYVIGLLPSKSNNSIVEYEMQKLAVPRGFDIFRNQDVFPYTFSDKDQARELTLAKIKEVACDGILTIALKDVTSETSYVGGSSVSVGGYPSYHPYQQPTADSPYPAQSYYGTFNNYYYNYYTVASSPGYYQTDKTYFLESNFFDANTYEILWSIQSKTYNPNDIEKVSKAYCEELFKELGSKKVLKPVKK